MSDEANPCAADNHGKYGEDMAPNASYDNMFGNSHIDKSFFPPWMMDAPMQQGFGGGSSSSSRSAPASTVGLTRSESSFSAGDDSATSAATPDQLLELSAADTSLTSLLDLSATDSAGDLKSWGKESETAQVDATFDGHGSVGSTLKPLSLEPRGEMHTEFDSCCCLLSSISFLERLVFRSASRENRIDLLLAEVRNSIETLAICMACERCAARAEQNMLLAMVARQISVIFRKTAECYKDMHLCSHGDTSISQQEPALDASSIGNVDISVPTYRVNRRERLHLLRSLITLQIVEFQ
ncbi:hypothetical protein PISL3812_01563 [Talaromyces islandicus]|uniref:Aflatoxin regulatory protein domain-containing protein n=1 Tax=Talaromyces islandicus TaxID=28573 RepID=A0A0U1LMQ4_TALIS|nr:hypothetical protein PISL3812_01563 [Talaromyces islandicus]